MSKVVISSYEDFLPHIGKELGVSDYLTITQEQINLFADATHDHQWIHVDPEKAKAESPYKATIAHGYLTVSLLPVLWAQIVDVQNTKLLVNYGIEKLKFNQAVTVGSDVRVRATLVSAVNLRGVIKAEIGVTMEIKDSNKPAFQGSVVFLYHFN
jgi:acyl dehydratase